MTNENVQQLAYPGVYSKENEIIPYSPRKQFRFMDDKIIKLESMKDMSIDQILELYKNGYRIEETSPMHNIATASSDISVSSGAIFLIVAGILAYLIIKR